MLFRSLELLIICGLLCGCDQQLAIYLYPGSRDADLPNLAAQTYSGSFEELHFRRADGVSRQYFFLDTPETNDIMVYFHGNGSTAVELPPVFADRNYRMDIAILEYTGFGLQSGTPSEAELLSDALGLIDELSRVRPEARQILTGFSLGGTLAILAASQRDVDGLLTIAAFTRTSDLAPGWAWPVLALGHQFDALTAAARVTSPWIILHCEDDTTVPSSMSGALFLARTADGTDRAAETILRVEDCRGHAVPNEFWLTALSDLQGLMEN